MTALLLGCPVRMDRFPPPAVDEPAPPVMVGGLDLGQAQDFTALAVVEKTAIRSPDRPRATLPHCAVRHLQRWPLGTPYPEIVAGVKALYAGPPLAGSRLAVDATGVGRAVVDLFRQAGIRAGLAPYTITAGLTPGAGTVPKKDLVGAVQALLCSRRLKIAPALPLAGLLAREMETFRVKVTSDPNETFASWRERDNDDLLLALALAVWYADRHPGSLADCYSRPKPRPPGVDRLTGLPRDIWR